jgi:hypothetical protein
LEARNDGSTGHPLSHRQIIEKLWREWIEYEVRQVSSLAFSIPHVTANSLLHSVFDPHVFYLIHIKDSALSNHRFSQILLPEIPSCMNLVPRHCGRLLLRSNGFNISNDPIAHLVDLHVPKRFTPEKYMVSLPQLRPLRPPLSSNSSLPATKYQ